MSNLSIFAIILKQHYEVDLGMLLGRYQFYRNSKLPREIHSIIEEHVYANDKSEYSLHFSCFSYFGKKFSPSIPFLFCHYLKQLSFFINEYFNLNL
jgi:hypothetical protein